MKKEVKKLCVSACIIIVSLVAIDITWGVIADKLTMSLADDGADELAKEKRMLTNPKEDVLIVGASSADRHFVPSILHDSISSYLDKNTSVYNGGLPGKYLDCNTLLIESLIPKSKGKLIIWDVNNHMFYYNGFATAQYFAPFYHKNTIAKQYIDSVGDLTSLKMMSSLYRYNISESFFKLFLGLLRKDNTDGGYEPLYTVMKIRPEQKEEKVTNTEIPKINNYLYTNFVRVVDLCKSNNVNFVIVSSPRYGNDQNTYPEKQDLLGKLCKEKNIPYIDMLDEEYFEKRPELFYDQSHLNDSGARIFTKMFFEKLKPYLDSMK
jgi:hypothetical protein